LAWFADMSADRSSLDRSRWSKRTARFIDVLCFVALLAVIGIVLYAFFSRAIWARGYVVVLGLGVIGAVVMLLGLAQQAIAARDARTWREMAEWQIRAARAKLMGGGAVDHSVDGALDTDNPFYYEHLAEALLENMRREEEGPVGR
jgi:hypothetical protein